MAEILFKTVFFLQLDKSSSSKEVAVTEKQPKLFSKVGSVDAVWIIVGGIVLECFNSYMTFKIKFFWFCYFWAIFSEF